MRRFRGPTLCLVPSDTTQFMLIELSSCQRFTFLITDQTIFNIAY